MYAVFIELSVAARTDPELAAILAPAEAAFVRELRARRMEVVPEWRDLGENFDIGYDFLICVDAGAGAEHAQAPVTEPDEEFLRYLEARLDELRAERRRMPTRSAPEPGTDKRRPDGQDCAGRACATASPPSR